MKEVRFVQLLLLVLLALAGGNTESLKDVRPMLENLGGGETLRAIENAERFASVLAAARGAGGGPRPQGGNPDKPDLDNSDIKPYADFPLAPIANIADGEIKARLARHIAVGD